MTFDATTFGFLLMAIVGLGFSAMFSGIETGTYTLNRVRLTVRAGRGDRAAVLLRNELQQPNRLLSTLLIGNNLANYTGSYAIAAILDRAGFGAGQAVLINAAVLIPLLFVVGEVLPKDLFRAHTDVWTYRCARFLAMVRLLLTAVGLVPLVTAFGRGSARLMRQAAPGQLPARERIAQLMLEGVGAGVISEAQAGLLNRALALRNRTIDASMLPWHRVLTIPSTDAGPARSKLLTRHASVACVIVLDERGQVIGAAEPLALLLDPEKPAGSLISRVVTLPTGTNVPRALREIRSADAHAAVVIDPRTKKPAGLVTVFDLVSPLTGGLVTAG